MLPSMKGTDPISIRRKRLEGSSLYDEGQSIDAYDRASVRVNKTDDLQDVVAPHRVSSLLHGSLYRNRRLEKSNSSAFCVGDDISEWGSGQEISSDVISNRAVAGRLVDLQPAASPLSSEASSESDSSFVPNCSLLSMRHGSQEDFSRKRLTSQRSLIWENHSRTLPQMDHGKRPSLHSLLTQFSPSNHTSSRPSTISSMADNDVFLYPAPVVESPSLGSSTSSGRESPSSYLIDDDPFANLGSPTRDFTLFHSPTTSTEQSNISSPASPILGQFSSPSSPLKSAQEYTQPPTSNAFVHVTPGRHRSSSSISQHIQLAKNRQTFVSRPSLPSLSTLARMNVNLPLKKRKGRVASTITAEPWSGCDGGSPSSLVSVAETGHSNQVFRSADSGNDLGDEVEDMTVNSPAEGRTPSAIFTGPPVLTSVVSRVDNSATDQLFTDIMESLATFDSTKGEVNEDTSELPRLSVHDEFDFFLPIETAYTHTELAYDPPLPTATGHSTSSQVISPKNTERRFGRYMLETSSLYKSRTSHQSSSTSSSSNDGFSLPLSLGMEFSHEVSLEVGDLTGWRPDNARMSGFEPGSSAGTVRPSSRRTRRSISSQELRKSRDSIIDENIIDYDILRTSVSDLVVSHSGGNNQSPNHYVAEQQQTGNHDQTNRKGGSDDEYQESSTNPYRGDKGSDDDDDDIYRSARSAFSTSTSSEDGSSAESQNEAIEIIDHPHEVLNLNIPVDRRRNGRKGVYKPLPVQRTESTEDDDVPLAQRIPSALKAQKSIRKQVKDEQVQRKREKMKSVPSSPTRDTSRTKSRSVERGRHISAMQQGSSSLRRAEVPRTPNPENRVEISHNRRGRAKTIGEGGSGVAADDLANRLLELQIGPSTRAIQSTRSEQDRSHPVLSPMSPNYKSTASPKYPANYIYPVLDETAFDQGKTIRSARSFHSSNKADSSAIMDSVQKAVETSLQQSPLPRIRQEIVFGPQTSSKATNFVQSEERSVDPSLDYPRKLVKSNRQTHETNRPVKSAMSPPAKSPISPIPETKIQNIAAMTSSLPVSPLATTGTATQIRIFIDNLQKFRVIEIGQDTNAGAVVETVYKRGELMDASVGNYYMLWEICQDFGIERPIRGYELLADISSSWNVDKMVNVFMIKKTSLAPFLSVQNMPGSAPRYGGYVEWESKRGKWSKRWLELREHGLWMSKREGKGDFLCSLSTFDGYFVTRINKSPKPFVFAVKSTDPISLFENKADYMHVFCCNEGEGTQWIQNILLAKSYVMYQERHVLFSVKNSNTAESTRDTSDVLSRSGTHRAAGHRPSQPLVNVTPSLPAITPVGPFEPGSLLAKRTAENTHM